MKTPRIFVCLVLMAAGLAACGGNPTPVPITEVPVSAADTPEAYTTFAQALPASETAEPLSLDQVASAPTSETGPPVLLD